MGAVLILAREGFPDQVTSGQAPGGRQRMSGAGIWEGRVSGRGSGRCKGPEVRGSLASSRNGTEASVVGANGGDENRGTGEGYQIRLWAIEKTLD